MVSSLIPPKIATPASVSGGGTTASMDRVVEFYQKLPKGTVSDAQRFPGFQKYFNGKDVSGKPLVILIGGLFTLGYSIHYLGHLRHHKHAHH